MAKLTDGVEAEMKARMAHIDTRTLQTFDHLDRLNPKIDELRLKLSRMEEQFTRDIGDVVTVGHSSLEFALHMLIPDRNPPRQLSGPLRM